MVTPKILRHTPSVDEKMEAALLYTLRVRPRRRFPSFSVANAQKILANLHTLLPEISNHRFDGGINSTTCSAGRYSGHDGGDSLTRSTHSSIRTGQDRTGVILSKTKTIANTYIHTADATHAHGNTPTTPLAPNCRTCTHGHAAGVAPREGRHATLPLFYLREWWPSRRCRQLRTRFGP